MTEPRMVWALCPICKKRVEVDVNVDEIKNAKNYPVSVVNFHGSPGHLLVLYLDAELNIRGVEGHKTLVTEDVQDAVALAVEEFKAKGRVVHDPSLLKELTRISGVEFIDAKSKAIVALQEPGPTTGSLVSPSGRIKARFVFDEDKSRMELEPLLREIINALEKVEPLSPATLHILIKILEASVEEDEKLEPFIIQNVAESVFLMPIIVVKPLMFDAMQNYILSENYATEELAAVREKLDGTFTLLELIELIEEKGLSSFRLLQALDKLHAGEAIKFKKRSIPGLFRYGR